jgi:hypothetical protein
VSIPQTIISSDSFQRLIPLVLCGSRRSSRYLSVKRHDGAEGVSLGDESELAWGLLIVLAEGLHLLLLDRDQSLSKQICYCHPHNLVPYTLSVVEDSRVFLLFFCAIEKASLQSDKEILKDPLQEFPAHKVIFIHEKLSMLLTAARERKP